MLTKFLNPFNIKVTEAKPSYVYIGTYTGIALHIGFYATVIHFILKFW